MNLLIQANWNMYLLEICGLQTLYLNLNNLTTFFPDNTSEIYPKTPNDGADIDN